MKINGIKYECNQTPTKKHKARLTTIEACSSFYFYLTGVSIRCNSSVAVFF